MRAMGEQPQRKLAIVQSEGKAKIYAEVCGRENVFYHMHPGSPFICGLDGQKRKLCPSILKETKLTTIPFSEDVLALAKELNPGFMKIGVPLEVDDKAEVNAIASSLENLEVGVTESIAIKKRSFCLNRDAFPQFLEFPLRIGIGGARKLVGKGSSMRERLVALSDLALSPFAHIVYASCALGEHANFMKRLDEAAGRIAEFGDAYIKPALGANGNYIFRLRVCRDGISVEATSRSFAARTSGISRTVRDGQVWFENAPGQLQRVLKSITDDIFQRYAPQVCSICVEKTIDSLKYRGNNFDVRVLVQRTPDSGASMKFEYVTDYCKAGSSSFISNVCKGGTAVRTSEVAASLASEYGIAPEEVDGALFRIRKSSVRIAEQYVRAKKREYEIRLPEIADTVNPFSIQADFALALDGQGKLEPYLLELNFGGAEVCSVLETDPATFRHALRNELAYAKQLWESY